MGIFYRFAWADRCLWLAMCLLSLNNANVKVEDTVWEELATGQYSLGLYDGLAYVVGRYMHGINSVVGEIPNSENGIPNNEKHRLGNELLLGLCNTLRTDNPRFNEARFRKSIANWQDIPLPPGKGGVRPSGW